MLHYDFHSFVVPLYIARIYCRYLIIQRGCTSLCTIFFLLHHSLYHAFLLRSFLKAVAQFMSLDFYIGFSGDCSRLNLDIPVLHLQGTHKHVYSWPFK